MATNNARARAAREYMKAHPGTKYTEALRIVSEEAEAFALIAESRTGKSHPYANAADPRLMVSARVPTLFFRHTEDAAGAIRGHGSPVSLTCLEGMPGCGKSVALIEHARNVTVPLRVIFTTTGEWRGLPTLLALREPHPSPEEHVRYHEFRSAVCNAAADPTRTLVVDLSSLERPLQGGETGSLGLTWEQVGAAILDGASMVAEKWENALDRQSAEQARFFEVIMDGDFHDRSAPGLPAVEGISSVLSRTARSHGFAAHVIYTGYGHRSEALLSHNDRVRWSVWGATQPADRPYIRDVPVHMWDALFAARSFGRFWVEDPVTGGWDPLEVHGDGVNRLAFDIQSGGYVPAIIMPIAPNRHDGSGKNLPDSQEPEGV